MSKTPLLVHLIFHPASDNAHNLALTIHKALNADPALPGLRLSTVFCPTDGVLPPADYPLDEAERNFVVVLADYWVVDGNSGQLRTWSGFIGDLWAACDTSPNRFFPVQLDETAWGFDPRLAGTTFLRGFAERDPAARATLVIRRLVIELCRYLADEPQGTDEHSKAPVKLFLSHAKVDLDSEPKVFHALEDYLRQDQPVRAWIDSGNIEAGSAFGERITTGIQDSSVLCVLTDNYSTREWCRKEVLLAKEHRRPLVVIAAFNSQEVRSFPYLGNVPVFRWPCPAADAGQTAALHRNAAMAAVDLMLKETLRHLHTRLLLEDDKQDGDILLSRPPELLSVLQAREAGAILYPDPPLGLEELNLLGNAVPVPLTTPLARLASQRPLQGTRIGLTMSESTDIHRFGLDPLHLGDAMIEISRYLLIKGATLVYGGDLQPADAHQGGNYTHRLFELVRTHHDLPGIEYFERIVNRVGWPLPYNQQLIAQYHQVATLERIPRPDDLDGCPGRAIADAVEANPFATDATPAHRYCWARGMTRMRESLVTADSGIAARIVLGGKFGPPAQGPGSAEPWYRGRIPGVLEEVALAAQAGQPVFLVGAFGGATALVIDLLEGRDRPEATWDFQRRAPHSDALRALYTRCNQPWWDYPEIVALLRAKGVAGINPLLTEDENRELFHIRCIRRLVELILTGLGRLGT